MKGLQRKEGRKKAWKEGRNILGRKDPTTKQRKKGRKARVTREPNDLTRDSNRQEQADTVRIN